MERPVRLDRKCRVIDIVKLPFDKLQQRVNMGTEQSRQQNVIHAYYAPGCS